MTDLLLLSEEEAAKRLLMHPRTLRKLRQSGQIRYVALTGRKIAYRAEDCAEFVEKQTRLATPIEHAGPRPRARPRRKDSGNVLSFTARRLARQQGLSG